MIRTNTLSDEPLTASIHCAPRSQPCVSRKVLNVPVMNATLLLVELEAEEVCVDLDVVSKFILSDLGATLHVFRMSGREFRGAHDRPVRMEDCITGLGVRACIEALSAHSTARDRRTAAVTELWSHSREVGKRARRLAEQAPHVDPDEAYLVGLCHSIGSLPEVLGVSKNSWQELDRLSLKFASEWLLPSCVTDYFRDRMNGRGGSRCADIVEAAHAGASEASGTRCATGNVRPQLLWAV